MSHVISDLIGSCRPSRINEGVSAELAGMRVQLMKVMNCVHEGGQLIYRLETGAMRCEMQCLFGECLIGKDDWLTCEVVPLCVPGTFCPQVVGDSLLRFGWVEPTEDEFKGYAHNFVLSEAGEKALAAAKSWWKSLNWLQKAWLYVME